MNGKTEKAVDFLKKFYPNGPWVVTSISPDKKGINTSTFEDVKSLTEWIDRFNGNRNIYFSVNQTNRAITSKANKEDIRSAHYIHVDIDPADGTNYTDPNSIGPERERLLSLLTDKLPKGLPKPTFIVFSGGGYQGFWKLEQPVDIDGNIDKANEFELYNKRLEQVFGGDHCHNVDRIMRVPGTVNIPDSKKRKSGRVEELAVLMEYSPKNVYSLDEFKKAQAVQITGPSRDGGSYGVEVNIPGNVERLQDLSELDQWNVPDRTKVVIAQGHHPELPKEKDNSRSSWLFDCVCSLVRCGVPDGVIFAILMDAEWGIASSVVELKSGAERYAIRQIKRAKEYSEDPNLTMMNDRHAIIGNIGGKCRVIEEIEDDVLHRSRITMSSFEDIRNRYGHIQIKIGTTEKGQDVMVPLGKYWIGHRMRRQFDTMRFMPQGDKPGVYNLWRGFNVEPRPGDCSIYLDHLLHNMCNGDAAIYDYLVKWMASAVQNPASPGEVAVVLRGGKGTGKGTFAKIFGRLFGRHYLQVANPSHLVGNFNSHLRDVIFLFADEAFFAGDKKHESVLKMLVTEDSIPIEAKGVDVESYPNYVHLMMASNDPHVIRATGDERRYFVLDMGERNKQDKSFFKGMWKQMENGGYEALLYHLQSLDLSDYEVRNVPETSALNEQKLLSMGVEEEWWYRKLCDGRILNMHSEWTALAPRESVNDDYIAYAEKWKFSRRGNETVLGKFLSRVCPHVDKVQRRVTLDETDSSGRSVRVSRRINYYDFGSLEACRDAWVEAYGKTDWPDPLGYEPDQPEEPF